MKFLPFFGVIFAGTGYGSVRQVFIYLFTLFLVGSKTFASQVLNLSGLSIPGATEGNGPLEVSSVLCVILTLFFLFVVMNWIKAVPNCKITL